MGTERAQEALTPGDPTQLLNAAVARAKRLAAACGGQLQQTFGVTPAELGSIRYSDGSRIARCRSDVALTIVGEPLVALCPRFWAQAAQDVDEAAVTILHESLHVSGLRERPMAGAIFTSHDIQNQVRRACKGAMK